MSFLLLCLLFFNWSSKLHLCPNTSHALIPNSCFTTFVKLTLVISAALLEGSLLLGASETPTISIHIALLQNCSWFLAQTFQKTLGIFWVRGVCYDIHNEPPWTIPEFLLMKCGAKSTKYLEGWNLQPHLLTLGRGTGKLGIEFNCMPNDLEHHPYGVKPWWKTQYTKAWGALRLVNMLMRWESHAPWLHRDRSSYTQHASRPCAVYCLIWLLICIPYYKTVTVKYSTFWVLGVVLLSYQIWRKVVWICEFVANSDKYRKPGNPTCS